MAGFGPWLTPPGRSGAGPLTGVHRPRGRQAVDATGAPAFDPKRSFIVLSGSGMIVEDIADKLPRLMTLMGLVLLSCANVMRAFQNALPAHAARSPDRAQQLSGIAPG